MSEKPDVMIVIMRCSGVHKSSGLRFEKRGRNNWVCTWAFELKETNAKREGYDKTSIAGSVSLDDSYPGCPYCSARTFFKCGSCNRVGCWDGETRFVTCPWCGAKGELQGYIQTLNVVSDQ